MGGRWGRRGGAGTAPRRGPEAIVSGRWDPHEDTHRYVGGPITRFLKALFGLLKHAGPQALLRDRLKTQNRGQHAIRRRAEVVEWYILGWLVLDGILLLAVGPGAVRGRWAALVITAIVVMRIIDILQAAVNVTIFDPLERPPGEHQTASIGRALVLGFINYAEFVLLFAIVYAAFLPNLHHAAGWSDAVYFSAVTQVTLGYGDLILAAHLRWFASAQGFLGIGFPILVIGRFISALPGIREGGRE